jgi:hypothetical protein
MPDAITHEEALRRVKLSIDRQVVGEIEPFFGDPGNKINMRILKDGLGGAVVVITAATGDWTVDADGDCLPCTLERAH